MALVNKISAIIILQSLQIIRLFGVTQAKIRLFAKVLV